MGGKAFNPGKKGEQMRRSFEILLDEVKPTLNDFFSRVLSSAGVTQITMLGSTGKKQSSGDLDIAVGPIPEDMDTKTYKYELAKNLESAVGAQHVIVGSNISVNYPIVTDDPERKGLRVQIDLMLSRDPKLTAWLMSGTGEGRVRGVYRNILLSYLAKNQSTPDRKITIAFPGGIQVVEAGETVVSRTEDPEKIMEILGIDGDPDAISDFSDLLDVTKDKFDLSGFVRYMDPYMARDPSGAKDALDVFHEKTENKYLEQVIRESIRIILEML